MRIIGLAIAATVGAAFYLLPVVEAAAQTPKMCAAKPAKPKNCADWLCSSTGWCQVKDGPPAVGCVAWKCNAVERKK
jgi:hypothetical protein